MQALGVDVAAGRMVLLGDRAAYLPEGQRLLIADLHLGKSHTFRRLGVPVPAGTTADDLDRLDRLIDCMRPQELVFLGDLIHARQGRSPAIETRVQAWRERHAGLEMRLVRGNHDSRSGDPPQSWGFSVVEEPWLCAGWALCHHPRQIEGHYALAGHLHPCISVGRGSERLRLPCFHIGPHGAVLPAFGGFTGMHPVRREPGDRVAVLAEGTVRLLAD